MLSTAVNRLVCQHLDKVAPHIAKEFRCNYECDPCEISISLEELVSSYNTTIFANSLVYKHLSKVSPHLMKDFKMCRMTCEESLDDLFVLYEKVNVKKRNKGNCGGTQKMKEKTGDPDAVENGELLETEFLRELEKYHPCFISSECESDKENEVCVLSQKEKPAKLKNSLNARPRKGENEVKGGSFRFSSEAVELSKISATLKSYSVKPKNSQKEKASNIFDEPDDPDVTEIIKRQKAEAKNAGGKANKGLKFVKGVQISQTLGHRKRNRFPNNCDDKECENPAKRQRNVEDLNWNSWNSATDVSRPKASPDSPDSIPMSPSLMISPVLPRKLAYLEVDEIGDDVENDSNYVIPDLDELLKLPERPADGSKTKDEILDEFDLQIAERQRLHEEEMALVEADIEKQNQKRIQRKLRLKENAKLRNRLENELTETRLRTMFQDNLEYLRDIWSGEVESWRHQAFHKSIRTRHALYYTIITDPFTDDQLDWTLDEIGKVWMSNRMDQLDNKEYVWKVLLPECFIKFYMDFFNVSKNEAMTRISETPLHKKDRLKEFD